ncbi:hypothetical protein IG631_13171 [Alternaria alternata]|nr:hypothetical protein IG631_13171 [Alternaria alternata]
MRAAQSLLPSPRLPPPLRLRSVALWRVRQSREPSLVVFLRLFLKSNLKPKPFRAAFPECSLKPHRKPSLVAFLKCSIKSTFQHHLPSWLRSQISLSKKSRPRLVSYGTGLGSMSLRNSFAKTQARWLQSRQSSCLWKL